MIYALVLIATMRGQPNQPATPAITMAGQLFELADCQSAGERWRLEAKDLVNAGYSCIPVRGAK